jgi:hypothetical protein
MGNKSRERRLAATVRLAGQGNISRVRFPPKAFPGFVPPVGAKREEGDDDLLVNYPEDRLRRKKRRPRSLLNPQARARSGAGSSPLQSGCATGRAMPAGG